MNEKLEKLNQEIEKTEKKLRWAQQEEKRLTHQAILNVGEIPPLYTYHFRQRLTRQTPGFPRSLYIRAESFKAGAIFYFRHIASPIYIV